MAWFELGGTAWTFGASCRNDNLAPLFVFEMMIELTCSLRGITPGKLRGFFSGRPTVPFPDILLNFLNNSYRVALAAGRVAGFVNAVSIVVLVAFIPLLEVSADQCNQDKHMTRLTGEYKRGANAGCWVSFVLLVLVTVAGVGFVLT